MPMDTAKPAVRISCAAILALILAVISFWIFSSFSVLVVFDVAGALLVAGGCVGDSLLLRNAGPERKWEKRFTYMIAVGVTIEAITLVISLRESAELMLKVRTLEAENLQLQASIAPREISIIQADRFIELLSTSNKGPVRLYAPERMDSETRDYALAVHHLLSKAGYPATNGIAVDLTFGVLRFSSWASISIVVNNRTSAPAYAEQIYHAITNTFDHHVGIMAMTDPDTESIQSLAVKTNEVLLYVSEKPRSNQPPGSRRQQNKK